MITANDVIEVLKSLKGKIDKETGREHNNISEGVETLVLGYGSGSADVWDGRILVDGEILKDVTDYYEEGRQAGLDEADRIIYGAFIFNEAITAPASESVRIDDPAGVYANFYDGVGYQTQLVSSIVFNSTEDLIVILNFDQSLFLKYNESDGAWSWGGGEADGELPDAIGRIIEFTSPVVVASAFFDSFDDVTATNIEDAVVAMVEQRLIDVSEEGM